MVTSDTPLTVGQRTTRAEDKHLPAEGLIARFLSWLQRAYCGLFGHDELLHFEKDRLSLVCASCGHRSPGWGVSDSPLPAVRPRGSRRQAQGPRLVDVKRSPDPQKRNLR